MKKPIECRSRDDLRRGYDFASMSGGIRGKHYQEYRKGSNVVLLQPDVAEAFPKEEAVKKHGVAFSRLRARCDRLVASLIEL